MFRHFRVFRVFQGILISAFQQSHTQIFYRYAYPFSYYLSLVKCRQGEKGTGRHL